MIVDRYRALFMQVERAIRGGWATERFWAGVEDELIQIENDRLPITFMVPQSFTTEDQLVEMMNTPGVSN